jgi:hypothetical protein
VECLEGASEVLVEVLTDNNQEDTQTRGLSGIEQVNAYRTWVHRPKWDKRRKEKTGQAKPE